MRNEISKLRQELIDRAKQHLPDDEWEGLARDVYSLNAVELVMTISAFRQTDNFIEMCERTSRRRQNRAKG